MTEPVQIALVEDNAAVLDFLRLSPAGPRDLCRDAREGPGSFEKRAWLHAASNRCGSDPVRSCTLWIEAGAHVTP